MPPLETSEATSLIPNLEPERLCTKIREIYPEVGRCGIDVAVGWNAQEEAWEVGLTRGRKTLKTFLEVEDVQSCLENERCINLGTKIGQLDTNVDTL